MVLFLWLAKMTRKQARGSFGGVLKTGRQGTERRPSDGKVRPENLQLRNMEREKKGERQQKKGRKATSEQNSYENRESGKSQIRSILPPPYFWFCVQAVWSPWSASGKLRRPCTNVGDRRGKANLKNLVGALANWAACSGWCPRRAGRQRSVVAKTREANADRERGRHERWRRARVIGEAGPAGVRGGNGARKVP